LSHSQSVNTTSLNLASEARRKAGIEKIAVEKFSSSGFGITYSDIQKEYSIRKKQAQRTLKYFHEKKVLFTARDLIGQGIDLLENKKPQQFFPVCKKAEIIEKLKKRKSRYDALEFRPLSNSDLLEEMKAQTFMDVLILLPYSLIYVHKLQLILKINKHQIKEIKSHEEIIGRRHVRYVLSANGTVQIAIKSNDTPFRLETELDVSIIFSFFGQVRDRLLYLLGDIKELVVTPVTEWTLVQCDVNKDIEIDDKAQITLPDIQLKYADRVFREYVKIIQGKAYYRMEESLKLNELLPVALDKIRFPFVSLEKRIEDLERNDNCQLVNKDLKTNLGSRLETASTHSYEKGEES
jgi:hypothetical protein